MSIRLPKVTDICICGHSRIMHVSLQRVFGSACQQEGCSCQEFQFNYDPDEEKSKNKDASVLTKSN